jgi:phosphoadenosine phosphosulfate reductase
MGRGRDARLKGVVERAADELDGASALEILAWADKLLDGRIVVATSLQDAVVIDLAAQVRPNIDVLFLNTGYHFAETLGMRDAVKATYPVRFLEILPGQSVEQQDATHGPELFRRDPDLCCFLRKVQPLDAMLGLYDGWVTGVRRSETVARRAAKPVEWDAKREMVKVNPIVAWTDEDVDAYIAERGVLVNPLLSEGYPSVGCAPCTARVLEGGDARAGRWAGTSKNECGIHL